MDSSLPGLVSVLDTDLYKLTMQQAVLRYFPDAVVSYKFTNRTPSTRFSRKCYDAFTRAVSKFPEVTLTQDERTWLASTCPYLAPDYLEYLAGFKYDLSQLRVDFIPSSDDPEWGALDIEAVGPWRDAIMWEVPLLAVLSEAYFATIDTDWNYDGTLERAYEKGKTLITGGVAFSEFGTRRRRSLKAHDLVVEGLVKAQKDFGTGDGAGMLSGTSNVYLAKKHSIKPVGTIAHEWFMGVAASKGYANSHNVALQYWEELYSRKLLVALTDTFSTQAFFKEFSSNKTRVEHWSALRQDSGDPFAFAPVAQEMYKSLGIDHRTKRIIYSDGLTIDLALRLKKQCDELGFLSAFGIGTNFSNDFDKASNPTEKSAPLNIVIKIASIDGKPCIKISDVLTKNTGDPETVRHAKEVFGLPVNAQ
ncbi:nicotinate phosphoribosyltransferase [Exidia glandulosa HHB12029]|uniref:Nicotinate phosphoribosyltransferase n=1 Tax=Exidia glandulosa HHB12029 TaxID=1314781 RepID=A0A165PYT8_EXIGL|nr:nicotinate phosphoribosyltransferase [Exidia glandulosa HHB12029]